MFTDRFIKVPLKIFNTQAAELTGKADYEDTLGKINPMEISAYYQTEDEGMECINLTLKSGWKSNIYMSMREFEKLLNSI